MNPVFQVYECGLSAWRGLARTDTGAVWGWAGRLLEARAVVRPHLEAQP